MYAVTRNLARTARMTAIPATYTAHSLRFASGSYGNDQSGHQQAGDEANPRRDLEHPGPEAPASKNSGTDSSSGARPTISQPASAAEEHDPEVRKHNEEMKNRADKSTNQLSEKDNKVDKKFWKGDVGDIKTDGEKK